MLFPICILFESCSCICIPWPQPRDILFGLLPKLKSGNGWYKRLFLTFLGLICQYRALLLSHQDLIVQFDGTWSNSVNLISNVGYICHLLLDISCTSTVCTFVYCLGMARPTSHYPNLLVPAGVEKNIALGNVTSHQNNHIKHSPHSKYVIYLVWAICPLLWEKIEYV